MSLTRVAILTVVRESDDSVSYHFRLPEAPKGTGLRYRVGGIPSRNGGRVEVAEFKLADRSNVPAASLTMAFLERLREHGRVPDIFVLSDIGAALVRESKGKAIPVGHVTFHEGLSFYEFRKVSSTSSKPRQFSFMPHSDDLLNSARGVDMELCNRLSRFCPEADFAAGSHAEQILSGDKLILDLDVPELEAVLGLDDKSNVLDMESMGVARALWDFFVYHGHPVKFLVVRGISDQVSRETVAAAQQDGGSDETPAAKGEKAPPSAADLNQQTRDGWKPYAAEIAAAFTLGLIVKETDALIEGDAMDELFAVARGALAAIEENSGFPLDIERESDDERIQFEELLVGDGSMVGLVGKPGAGKSWLLSATAKRWLGAGNPAVVLDLEQLSDEDWEIIEEPGQSDRAALAALFSVSQPPDVLNHLIWLPEDASVLIAADGLNEVYGRGRSKKILDLLKDLANACRAKVRVIISDRQSTELAARGIPIYVAHGIDRVRLAQCIRDHGLEDTESEDDRNLLRLPFYFKLAAEMKSTRLGSAASAHRRYFQQRIHLTAKQLGRLGQAALDAYMRFKSPVFSSDEFKNTVGSRMWDTLRNSEVIVIKGVGYGFEHQLHHDFLAAHVVAKDARLWRHDVFDAITLKQSSAAIELAVCMQKDQEDGDRFVRATYDWNAYGAFRCAAAAAKLLPRLCSTEMEIAMVCICAEKALDPVRHSRERAVGSLDGFTGGARLKGKSIAEIIEVAANEQPESPWFKTWHQIFCELHPNVASEIVSDNAIIGWTAANVLRRDPSKQDTKSLVRQFAEQPPVVKWRIVHALGVSKDDEAVALLCETLRSKDEERQVRYGAARALVEIAATTEQPEQRSFIVEILRDAIDEVEATIGFEIGMTCVHYDSTLGWGDSGVALVERAIGRLEGSPYETDLRLARSFCEQLIAKEGEQS